MKNFHEWQIIASNGFMNVRGKYQKEMTGNFDSTWYRKTGLG
jgi:hypothetical protein